MPSVAASTSISRSGLGMLPIGSVGITICHLRRETVVRGVERIRRPIQTVLVPDFPTYAARRRVRNLAYRRRGVSASSTRIRRLRRTKCHEGCLADDTFDRSAAWLWNPIKPKTLRGDVSLGTNDDSPGERQGTADEHPEGRPGREAGTRISIDADPPLWRLLTLCQEQ